MKDVHLVEVMELIHVKEVERPGTESRSLPM